MDRRWYLTQAGTQRFKELFLNDHLSPLLTSLKLYQNKHASIAPVTFEVKARVVRPSLHRRRTKQQSC